MPDVITDRTPRVPDSPPPSLSIEEHGIERIPPDQRFGKANELFGIWFGWNFSTITLVTGGLATAVFGLSFWWSLLALTIGNAVGGIAAALHAGQGPKLGVPQMLQARAQFGFYGAWLLVVIAFVMFMGFFVSNMIIAGQAMHLAASGVSINLTIIISVIVSLVLATIGYRLIRTSQVWQGLAVMAVIAVSLVWMISDGTITSDTLTAGTFTWPIFLSVVALGAVWGISIAPYVSDYSRYLPEDTGPRAAFHATYWGMVLSAIVLMSIGALIGVGAAETDLLTFMHESVGGFGAVAMIVLALSAMIVNAMSGYSSVLCTLTAVETFKPRWIPSVRARVVACVIIHVAGGAIAIAGQGNFVHNYYNFVTVLLYVLIPWSAINLVDYYLIRRGNYDVAEFFESDSSRYGRWNIKALVCFAIGVAAEVPFWVTEMYTGPLAEGALEYIDIAWIVGLVVSGVVYYVVARRDADSEPASAPRKPLVGESVAS